MNPTVQIAFPESPTSKPVTWELAAKDQRCKWHFGSQWYGHNCELEAGHDTPHACLCGLAFQDDGTEVDVGGQHALAVFAPKSRPVRGTIGAAQEQSEPDRKEQIVTQFDETKHNRAADGKFANKPHAEAHGVTLTPTDLATQLLDLPQDQQETMLDHLQTLRIAQWAGMEGGYEFPELPEPEFLLEVEDDEFGRDVTCTLIIDDSWEVSAYGSIDDSPGMSTSSGAAEYLGMNPQEWDQVEDAVWEAHARAREGVSRFGALNPQAHEALTAHAFGTGIRGVNHPPEPLRGHSTAELEGATQSLYATLIDRRDDGQAPTWPTSLGPVPTGARVSVVGNKVELRGTLGDDKFTALIDTTQWPEDVEVTMNGRDTDLDEDTTQTWGEYMMGVGERARDLHRWGGLWSGDGDDAVAAARYATNWLKS